MIAVSWISESVTQGHYHYSRHADRERLNDGLTLDEIEEALISGRILEHYPDTGRGESCLVAGFSDDGKPIHIVCAGAPAWLIIVMVYIPTPPKFKNPYERGERHG